jgi:hypothetical protein
MEVLEGNDQGRRMVIIEFPSLQRAKGWYYSEEYQRVKALREGKEKTGSCPHCPLFVPDAKSGQWRHDPIQKKSQARRQESEFGFRETI